MLRKILVGIVLLIVAAIGAGLYFMHRYESRLERESREQLQKLKPMVIAGEGEFKKRLFLRRLKSGRSYPNSCRVAR